MCRGYRHVRLSAWGEGALATVYGGEVLRDVSAAGGGGGEEWEEGGGVGAEGGEVGGGELGEGGGGGGCWWWWVESEWNYFGGAAFEIFLG